MIALDAAIGLDESLRVLVKLRGSLTNGCVYCIDLHSREGLDAGERPEGLFGLASWRESPFFDERERAALALTDTVTLVADGHVPDEIRQEARGRTPHRVRRATGPNAAGYCMCVRSLPCLVILAV
jgi:AhpD family alkylhydroperoxidase